MRTYADLFARSAFVLLLIFFGAGSASAVTIFSETFDGYTYFPDEFPANDPINFGEPLQSEGADNDWYGARFEAPDSPVVGDPIEDIRLDIGVQKFPGGTGTGPVGRVGDDAGILFRIDLTNVSEATLAFDWRMFSVGSSDKLVVGYYEGDDLGFGPTTPIVDFVAAQGGHGNAVTWWQNSWTEVIRDNQGSSWSTESDIALAVGGVVWVGFWIDNGDGDFAKIDNITVGVTGATNIPEPGTALLLGVGLLGLAGRRSRD